MSIVKAGTYQDLNGTSYNVPIKFTRYEETTFRTNSSTGVWATLWTFTHASTKVGSRNLFFMNLQSLLETNGKTINIRVLRDSSQIYFHNSLQECAFSGWFTNGSTVFFDVTSNSTATQTYEVQFYHNTGSVYLNYPYNGLGNPKSEVMIMEVQV